MRRSWLAALLLPFVFLLAPSVRAGEKSGEAPAVVVRVKSLDALLQNVKLVVKLIDQEGAADQIEGLIKSKIGKKGLEGINPSQPFGAYLRFGEPLDKTNVTLLVPMTDPKTFLTLLDNLSLAYTKDKDDVYTHKTDKNVNVYFRFAHKYLYVTSPNPDGIQTKILPDPAQALALPGDATISVVARIDQIPLGARLAALMPLQKAIETAKKKQPGEGEVQAEFRVALMNEFNDIGLQLAKDASEVRFDLNVDEKNKELTANFNVIAKPGSALAASIKEIGARKSALAGLVTKDLAFQGSVHLAMPAKLQMAFGNVLAEAKEKALAGLQDDAKKLQANSLFDGMMATVNAGEFQVVAAVVGPMDKHFAFLGALKLKDGDKLGKTVEKLLEEALKTIPKEQKDKIKTHTAGAIKIHEFELPKDGKIDQFLAIAGDDKLYVAFRDDAMFLAIGKGSLTALKTVLAKKDSAVSQPLVFDFDAGRMASFIAQTDEQKALAAKLFPAGEDARVRLTIAGGASLSASVTMRLNVLEFLVKMKNVPKD